MSRKTSRKSRVSRWTTSILQHPKRKGGIQRPSNSNVRGFQSNQSISDINNIHTDLLIESFDRRNQNIDKKTKSVNLY